MQKVYLDGELVDSSIINPKEHKFIGMFRSPNVPDTSYIDENNIKQFAEIYACPCGQMLWTIDTVFKHWQMGHMDIPQYLTINI